MSTFTLAAKLPHQYHRCTGRKGSLQAYTLSAKIRKQMHTGSSKLILWLALVSLLHCWCTDNNCAFSYVHALHGRTSERDNKCAKNKDCQGLQYSNRPFSHINWQFKRYLKAVKSSVAHFLSNEYSQYSAELSRLLVTGSWNFGRSHAIISPLFHAVLNTQG